MNYFSRAGPKKVAAAIVAKGTDGHYGAPIKPATMTKKQVDAVWKDALESSTEDAHLARLGALRALGSQRETVQDDTTV